MARELWGELAVCAWHVATGIRPTKKAKESVRTESENPHTNGELFRYQWYNLKLVPFG